MVRYLPSTSLLCIYNKVMSHLIKGQSPALHRAVADASTADFILISEIRISLFSFFVLVYLQLSFDLIV